MLVVRYETEVSLGQAIFGNTPLGDRRRTTRLVETFDLMQRHPGGTLPDKLASPADEKAVEWMLLTNKPRPNQTPSHVRWIRRCKTNKMW